MARTATTRATAPSPTRPSTRIPGPDVVRAVALIGVVVMNYHGYLLLRADDAGSDGALERAFDPFGGPLSTRFAATFVLVAGVGVTLLARSSIGDPTATAVVRWRLVRRGLVLWVGGLFFDTIWPGTILPYYGAMFAIAALLVTLRSRWIVVTALVTALAGAGIEWWRFEQLLDGQQRTWFDSGAARSPRTMLLDVFVEGTHPLLPWFAFFCAGIVVGRLLERDLLRPVLAAIGTTLYGVAAIVSDAVRAEDRGSGLVTELTSVDPYDRGLVYVASALGSSLVAFAVISWLAERYVATTAVAALRVAGQMTLTLYVLHALVFNLVVDWLGWIRPTGLDTALLFALAYWSASLAAAHLWSRRFDRGPLEIVYRRLTA